MPAIETILRTKLNPPRPRRNTLARPRIEALLREALNYTSHGHKLRFFKCLKV